MRIAILFEFGSLNGGENSMLAVIDSLQGRDIEFATFAPSRGPLTAALRARGVSPIAFDVRDVKGQRRPRGIVAGIGRPIARNGLRPGARQQLVDGPADRALADELPIPATAHLRDIIKLSGAAMADLNRNARLVAVSHATRAFHMSQGLRAERVHTIYNGVETGRFQPRVSDGSLRRELGLSAEDFLVLTVGQIGLRKGQDVLADAAVRLSRGLPSARYLLAGQRFSEKAESRAFEERVLQTLESLGKGRLCVLGYRDDVPRLMNAADVLVHPAHQEPLGRVLLEAAASGLPIIATDVGGTAEILRDGESALLIPPGDAEALADAMLRMASAPDLRTRLAANARRRIVANFSIAQAAENLHAFWRDACCR